MARFSGGSGGGEGIPGPVGPQGDSAYEVAVDNGFVGTEQEWLDSLGGGGTGADIADFIFTSEESQSVISLPGDRQMRIQGGEDSDLYLTAGDDLYIQTLGFGDDIFIQAADDVRFTAGRENIEEGGRSYSWSMNSEGELHLPEDGYISNPYATVVTSSNRSATYTDNYLNNQSGLSNVDFVALPVDENSVWFANNFYSGVFTSPVAISFADGDSTTAVAIYDATSQGTPAVIFQWNDLNRQKTFEQAFPLNVYVDYTATTYDGTPTIVLDPGNYGGDQKLVVDVTAPNHVHLRAGGAIDQSTAEIFLGGEDTHVRVTDQSGSVEILGTDITISSYVVPSSLNINTYSGAVVNSNRTSSYDPEDKVVATLGDIAAARFGASASYYSTADQGPVTVNTPTAFTFTNTDWQTGVTLQNTNELAIANAGKYNIAFSAQLHQTNGAGVVNIWLTKNGTPIENTNTKVAITSNNPYSVAAWNLFVDAAAGDVYKLMWSSSSANTVVEHEDQATINGYVHPAVPSIILTVNQVG